MGKFFTTNQTGPKGKEVKRIYVQEAYDIEKELYLSCLIDRESSKLLYTVQKVRVDIESVAEEKSGKDNYYKIDLKDFYQQMI